MNCLVIVKTTMNNFRLFIIINFFLFLLSCGSLKEGLAGSKKNNTDEFLVEKKSPLIMPPNYEELPIPQIDKIEDNLEENNIKKLIVNRKKTDQPSNNLKSKDKTFEEFLLKKIKKD